MTDDYNDEDEGDELVDRFSAIYSHLTDEIDKYLRMRFDAFHDSLNNYQHRELIGEVREQTHALQRLAGAVEKIDRKLTVHPSTSG